MSGEHNVTFRLKGKHPDELPIDRLAQYLTVLSDLVGSPGKVRVKKIVPGSVRVELAVARDHYPKFVERLAGAKNPAKASAQIRRTVSNLEEMIMDDQVTAEVVVGRTKLFYLRGYAQGAGEAIGPVVQRYVVRGRIIGLEGKDSTKHVRIAEYGADREIRGEFRDDELARKLAANLWKDVVELAGVARLIRHPDGAWEVKSFKIDDVQELTDERPSEIFKKLKGALGEVSEKPAVEMTKIRG